MRISTLLLLGPWLALPVSAVAQTSAVPVPSGHIPASVVAELRHLEARFDQGLAQDCSSDRCFSKGCVYGDHIVIDKPRSTSLPGLGESAGPGSVQAQEYLTRARCEFAHERRVSSRDVAALKGRLTRKLSKGWMTVTISSQVLSPVSAQLREPPPEPEPAKIAEPEPEDAALIPEEPLEWDSAVALREFWVSLLPSFSWMITLGLGTLAALALIWGWRRLGHESLEEKMLMSQLAAGGATAETTTAQDTPSDDEAELPPANGELTLDEDPFITDQRSKWGERISKAQLNNEGDVLSLLVRDWLQAGQFAMLAKAVFLFSEHLTEAFPAEDALAMRKLEFVEYLQGLDESTLPSEEEFFRKLNHHAIASTLMAQPDTEIYRCLREEFGPSGVVDLINSMPPRYGALIYALSTPECQLEVAGLLSPSERVVVAAELMLSSRMSKADVAHIFETLRAARAAEPLPAPPADPGIADHGRWIDAAASLSALLPALDATSRIDLFQQALQRSNGTLPRWYENILYPEMLLRVPANLRADMLLDVDIRDLAAWCSLQPAAWQQSFYAEVPDSIRNAMQGGMRFETRAEQMTLAEKGRRALALATQKLIARGHVSLTDLVA